MNEYVSTGGKELFVIISGSGTFPRGREHKERAADRHEPDYAL